MRLFSVFQIRQREFSRWENRPWRIQVVQPYLPSLMLILFTIVFSTSDLLRAGEPEAASAFARAKASDPELIAFLKEMPKGADLHTHLSGAVYAETWLRAAVRAGLFFEPATGRFAREEGPGRVPAGQLLEDNQLLYRFLNEVSMRGNAAGGPDGHDLFFETFNFINSGPRQLLTTEDMLVEVINRARSQHVQYLEMMANIATMEDQAALTAEGPAISESPSESELDQAYEALAPRLERYVRAVKACLDERDRVLAERLGIPAPGVSVTPIGIRYILQLNRLGKLSTFFAEAAGGMAAVKADPRVVSVNMVAPEDHPLALEHFDAQMKILDFLWRRSGRPALTLHAGELSLQLSPVEPMFERIRNSIELGHARRIGHGVAVAWDRDVPGLLAEMRRDGIAVEICLTSNHGILGISGPAHPFHLYRSFGVPLCLCTDDEGINRSNLTMEFVRAVREQGVTYLELKELVRNSLEYSFLSGESLYLDRNFRRLRPELLGVRAPDWRPSAGAQTRCAASPKLQAQVALERAFIEFEKHFPPAARAKMVR